MNLYNVLTMGGYGLYVWTTYSLTLLVFGINVFASFRERKQVKNILRGYLSQP